MPTPCPAGTFVRSLFLSPLLATSLEAVCAKCPPGTWQAQQQPLPSLPLRSGSSNEDASSSSNNSLEHQHLQFVFRIKTLVNLKCLPCQEGYVCADQGSTTPTPRYGNPILRFNRVSFLC